MKDWGIHAPSRMLIERGNKIMLDEAADKLELIKQGTLDPAAEGLVKQLEQGVLDYWNSLFSWSQKEGGPATAPFVPPAVGSPMLNLFTPPIEGFEPHNDEIDQALIYDAKLNSSIGFALRN
jgi:hypothetical protein